jgi:hypothetical protein
MLTFLIITNVFSSTKLENKRLEQVLLRSRWGAGEEVAQTMYTHVSECKNDKIKKRTDILIDCVITYRQERDMS